MHLRPDRLRAHAADTADVAGALEALGRAPGPAAERIDFALRRALRELAEIEAALRGAAAHADAADQTAAAVVARLASRP
ncbi:MAG TPA: hypothetical protein VGE11_07990 [Pseudonocardia sp.]